MKKLRITLVGSLLIACGITAGVAQAAGFDCTKAQTPVEKTICSDPVLGVQDQQLNERWRAALGVTRYTDALRSDQIGWLGSRNRCGTDRACLRRAYALRFATLAPAAIEGQFQWEGNWARIERDRWKSSRLALRSSSADRFAFQILTAENALTSTLGGNAQQDNGKLRYVSADEKCEIVFHQVHRQLDIEVHGEGCERGAAWASGRYLPIDTDTPLAVDEIDPGDVAPDWNLLSLGIIYAPETDERLRALIETSDYRLLVDAVGRIGPPVDTPSLDAVVRTVSRMSPRGELRGWLAQSPAGELWTLVYDLEQAQIRYYSDAPRWAGLLPPVAQRWLADDSRRLPVKLMTANGKTLTYPYDD